VAIELTLLWERDSFLQQMTKDENLPGGLGSFCFRCSTGVRLRADGDSV